MGGRSNNMYPFGIFHASPKSTWSPILQTYYQLREFLREFKKTLHDSYQVLPQFLSPLRKGICCIVGDNVRRNDFRRESLKC